MLETLLRDGPAYHDTQSERLAGELESAANGGVPSGCLVQFMQLSTHTIGEHLADWPRALALAERVMAQHEPSAETAMAWGRLSIARFLAGDAAGAAEAELICMNTSGERKLPALVTTKFWLIGALVGSFRVAEAAALFEPALVLARGIDDRIADRAVAASSNNLALDILDAMPRPEDEQALMMRAAEAAHEFWRRCGDWINEERAYLLKAQVANAIGAPEQALTHAEAGIKIIAANTPRPFDRALLHLERAKAFAATDEAELSRQELARGDECAKDAPRADLIASYEAERGKAFGAG